MDVRLSPEQQALRQSAAQVVDRLGPGTVADLDDEERTAKLDAAVSASGWREMRGPGEGPAPLASAVEVALVAEELARGAADTPFAGPTLAADLRRRSGSPAGAPAETVLLSGDLATVASDEPDDLAAALALDARDATVGLAVRREPSGDTVVSVPIGEARHGVDLTRLVGRATGPAAEVGAPVSAVDLDAWLALGLALTSAELVGTMAGAVRLACEYAAARKQYGVAVGSFQAVQHMLADAHVAVEGSRSVALHSAWAVDALPAEEALFAAAVAKAYCARAARDVCETVIQVHGGIGNTWECMAHVFLRRSLLSTDVLGGVGASLGRVLRYKGIGVQAHGLR